MPNWVLILNSACSGILSLVIFCPYIQSSNDRDWDKRSEEKNGILKICFQSSLPWICQRLSWCSLPASNPSRFEALGTLVLRHCDGIDATCQLSAFQRIREDPFELTPPTFGHCPNLIWPTHPHSTGHSGALFSGHFLLFCRVVCFRKR